MPEEERLDKNQVFDVEVNKPGLFSQNWSFNYKHEKSWQCPVAGVKCLAVSSCLDHL